MKPLKRIILLLSSAMTLLGCSGVDVLNFTIPRSGYSIQKDIAYGNNPRQKLDVYVPDSLDPSKAVIVFFYGGSWKKGSKDDYLFAGQAFASKGYVTVIADYRLYPEVYYPDFLRDNASAVSWVHHHIGEYGGDPTKIFLAGHSAGAYNAMMLTLDRSCLEAAGGSRSWIKGTIGLAGPYDFTMTDPEIIAIFSQYPYEKTQPINYVGSHLPPIILLAGDQDIEVDPRNSQRLAAKLNQYNDPVELHMYPDIGHIGIVLALARGFRGKAPVLDDVDAFVQENVK